MMPQASTSSIRVFVRWTEQTVFAGEDVECEIIFKNVASTTTPSTSSLRPLPTNGFAVGAERHKTAPASHNQSSSLSPRTGMPNRGNRTSLSPTVPVPLQASPAETEMWSGSQARAPSEASTHKRSVSIISMGKSESATTDRFSANGSLAERAGRAPKGHGRSASLQIVPRRHGANGPISAPMSHRFSFAHMPRLGASSHETESTLPERPARGQSGASTAPNTPGFARRSSHPISQNFKFPTISSVAADTMHTNGVDETKHPQKESNHLLSPRAHPVIPVIAELQVSTARILSPSSATGTPRSSGEFYSHSNNSTETLASEYFPQSQARSSYTGHVKRPSNLSAMSHHRPPETLMMGYAQIHGSFTLDGSLISQAPFEEVKRKGAVGGQGGGVIGVETKRDSGLLRAFGWGLGESIGGFLGSGELSSIKDMRGIAGSKSIPLLSTPQSILFVDLRMAPGESRSFKYCFKLPRGLPPTHRGKAIKINYKLVIGTQRAGGSKEQQVKSVEVPFRVLGSVNSHGELLGHDLMSPYIILRDQARVQAIKSASNESLRKSVVKTSKDSKRVDASTLGDFLSYVDELLSKQRQDSSLGLLSPTAAPRSRSMSFGDEPATAKEAIDMAILRSNTATEYQQSANRFEIARSGKRVAVVMLARPAYRLGETVTAAIDFTDAEIPCYAVHASLESSERVDSSLALRSEASILRVTRKVHASRSESSLFARRIVFSPAIPVTATPEFITSGVSLDWRIRIEFVTPTLVTDQSEPGQRYEDLLEEITTDDRGVVFGSVENLNCESFEIAVPLRIYGATAGGNAERDDGPVEGLVV